MYEKLFVKKTVVERHENAPYPEERWSYLAHCKREGYSLTTLRLKAYDLRWIAIKLSHYPDLRLTLKQIEAVAGKWGERQRATGHKLHVYWIRKRFIVTARLWLRFLGYFIETAKIETVPFIAQLEDYIEWMRSERGLSKVTLQQRERYLRAFLCWYGARGTSLLEVCPQDVDQYLAEGGRRGWGRIYIKSIVEAIKSFFRYGAQQGWCGAKLSDAIQGPRIYALEQLPTFPKWSEVQHLLTNMDMDNPADVRDRAILMLFAVYGFRASEVAHLRLEDLDWDQDVICVTRVKRRCAQQYPLVPTVGNAIARYLQEVRPRSRHQEVFLTLLAPIRPLSRFGLHSLTHKRLAALGVKTTHQGPHALRHACAAHLVSEGLSLKEIGDHLGHRSSSSTQVYAKVDLSGLREVAAFDLGEVL